MAGPTAAHGVEEVRRAGAGTQAAGSGHHQGRAGYDRDTGSECALSRDEEAIIDVRANIAIAVRARLTAIAIQFSGPIGGEKSARIRDLNFSPSSPDECPGERGGRLR